MTRAPADTLERVEERLEQIADRADHVRGWRHGEQHLTEPVATETRGRDERRSDNRAWPRWHVPRGFAAHSTWHLRCFAEPAWCASSGYSRSPPSSVSRSPPVSPPRR